MNKTMKNKQFSEKGESMTAYQSPRSQCLHVQRGGWILPEQGGAD